MSKFKIDRGRISEEEEAPEIKEAGTYWVKEIFPDRNTKFIKMMKTKSGPWFDNWIDKDGNLVVLRGEYKIWGPIPENFANVLT